LYGIVLYIHANATREQTSPLKKEKAKFNYASWFEAGRTSFEPASVMECGK